LGLSAANLLLNLAQCVGGYNDISDQSDEATRKRRASAAARHTHCDMLMPAGRPKRKF
jgi:hypothetical protein